MSGSDKTSWPVGERRRRPDRRSGRDRRGEAGWAPVSLDAPSADADHLVAAARQARGLARAGYSGFKVGAALELTDGTIVTGCNIENASYSLTVCAERVALLKALSEGYSSFLRIAVVADTVDPTPPCGPCRQLLWEYCGDVEVILANLERIAGRHRMSDLLPLPFDSRLLR